MCIASIHAVSIWMTFDLYKLSPSWRPGRPVVACHAAGLLQPGYTHHTHIHTTTTRVLDYSDLHVVDIIELGYS